MSMSARSPWEMDSVITDTRPDTKTCGARSFARAHCITSTHGFAVLAAPSCLCYVRNPSAGKRTLISQPCLVAHTSNGSRGFPDSTKRRAILQVHVHAFDAVELAECTCSDPCTAVDSYPHMLSVYAYPRASVVECVRVARNLEPEVPLLGRYERVHTLIH